MDFSYRRLPLRQLVFPMTMIATLLHSGCEREVENGGREDASVEVEEDSIAGGLRDVDAHGWEDESGREEREEGLAITGVEPDHGPAPGGNRVLVRGRGFTEGAAVYFGEHLVQPSELFVQDEHRIAVIVPPGSPGKVDVKVVIGEDEAILRQGYRYDIFYVDPPSGSVAGGTFVEIRGSGVNFELASSVTFDGAEATHLEVHSSSLISCRTPPGLAGPADVKVQGVGVSYEVAEAFFYYNHSDPIAGGLGGGPIDGTVNVSVLDYFTGDPVAQAFCILGTAPDTPYQGFTDSRGQITFSGPDLRGRQSITVSKENYERTTIVAFDAMDVTIFLQPYPDPSSGQLPPPSLGALVRGELVFEHAGEFGPGPWEAVPDPGEEEEKVAYVFATGDSIWHPPPSPGQGGARRIVVEDMTNVGNFGFIYSVFTRADIVAVWAVAGLRNIRTGIFVPYLFGVTRGIVAGPGEEVEGVLVYMVHSLDQSPTIEIGDYYPPLDAAYGPHVYRSELFLDLGGDGVIFRDDRFQEKEDASPFVYPAWPALRYELADASYTAIVGAYTVSIDPLLGAPVYTNPYSVKILKGIESIREPIVAKDFIGIPYPVDPPYGERIQNMRMSFGTDGATPDFWLVLLQSYPDQLPLWRILLPGSIMHYDLPDLESLVGSILPSDYVVWIVYGIEVPGFVFDQFTYRFLNKRYWSAYSADAFMFKF